MELMLIILIISALPMGLVYLNNKAKRTFSYMESNHKSLWVKLGSPKRIPGIVGGYKEPAFTFLFEGGYRDVPDSKLVALCSDIDKSSKLFAVGLGILLIGLGFYAATSI